MEYSLKTREPQKQDGTVNGFENSEVDVNRSVQQNDRVIFNSSMEALDFEEPNDGCRLAGMMFLVLGIAITLPWNLFYIANDYWMFKLRDVGKTESESSDYPTRLQARFTRYLGVASVLPNTLFLILHALYGHKISFKVRIVGSMASMVLLFLFMELLATINTDNWQGVFLSLALTTVALLNIASAVLQGALFGMVGRFSTGYVIAMMCAQPLGAILGLLSQIGSHYSQTSPTSTGHINFAAAIAVLGISVGAYFILTQSAFFKFHMMDKEKLISMPCDPAAVEPTHHAVPRSILFKRVFSTTWVYGYSLWITFFISFAMYPSITKFLSWIHDEGSTVNYLLPALGYMAFSAGDFKGRFLTRRIQWPVKPSWVGTFATLRVLVFIPLLVFYKPHQITVNYSSSGSYIAIIIVFALLHGYLSSLCLICVPCWFEDGIERETAMSMMAAIIGIGQACGWAISWLI